MRGRVQRRHGAGICVCWLCPLILSLPPAEGEGVAAASACACLCPSFFPSLLPLFAWPTRTQLQIYAILAWICSCIQKG